MPKSPFNTNEIILNPNNTVDPQEAGGLTYVSGTGFRMKVGTSTYTIPTSSAGAPKLSAITDPDADLTLAMGTYKETLASTSATWAGMILKNSHANPAAGASLLNLQYNADGDANGVFISCKDNAYTDSQFTVGTNGAITTEGDFTLATNKFTVAAATGNTLVAGTFDVTSDFKIATTIFTVTAATGAVSITGAGNVGLDADNKKLTFGASGATDAYIKFDAVGNMVFFDSTYAGEITLSQLTAIAPNPTITGDLTITDGKLTWSDLVDEVAGTWTFSNTASNDIAWTSAATTGNCLSITANSISTGSMLYLVNSAAGFSGEYIRCYDGAADDFVVGLYGATTIAGNASTDVLTVTAGDLQITAGDIDVDLGIITVDNTADEANYIARNFNGAGTAAVLEIEATHASSTKEALLVDHNGTGASLAVVVDHEGTGDCITITSKATGASLIKATSEVATGTVLEVITAASTTVSALNFASSGTAATGWLGADGVGLVHIASDGNLAHANASCLYIAYSGTGAATGLGTSLRIVDTGATASSYAAYISAATGEALFVDVGKVRFDEDLQLGAADGTGADLFVYSGSAGAYVHADTSEHEFRLAGTEILAIGGTAGAKDGLTIDFDGADVDIDAVTANDTIKFGSDVDTNVTFTTAASSLAIDHGANTFTVAAGGQLIATTGAGAGNIGTGLVIPHGTSAPDGTVAGSLYYETDAAKLWVYSGAGWVGVAVA
jgi:hypothetical protein